MYIKHNNDCQKIVDKNVLPNAPTGCTSKDQPLDVSIKKSFCSKMTVTRKQVLVTTWVAEACEIKIKKEMVFYASKKCNITIEEDGFIKPLSTL